MDLAVDLELSYHNESDQLLPSMCNYKLFLLYLGSTRYFPSMMERKIQITNMHNNKKLFVYIFCGDHLMFRLVFLGKYDLGF